MRGGAFELFVQRPALAEDAVQNVGGNPASGEPRHFGRLGESWSGHGG
jgi:hypothetical protein